MTFNRMWLLLVAAGGAPLLLAGVSRGFLLATIVWYAAAAGAALLDWMLLCPARQIIVEREVNESLSLAAGNPVHIRVMNRSRNRLTLDLRDSPPAQMRNDLNDQAIRFDLPSGSRFVATYHLFPAARGRYRFGDLYLRQDGKLGLVSRLLRIPASFAVKVYPDMQQIERFQMLARKGRLQQVGIRAARIQGAGREFESLRDYLPDDEMRRIDWKATARRGKLVSRNYEVERSQTVILMLDAGRTMHAKIDGVAKLDYAINAGLMLAYVAGLAEDQVGLIVFANTVLTYLPPRKGRSQLFAIREALYNVQATLDEPDYPGAIAFLKAHWRRRSLLVCFTDLWDPDSSALTIATLTTLQPRHLVAAVTLMDSNVLRMAEQEITDIRSVYESSVAAQVAEDRDLALAALDRHGVLVVDSRAEQLTAQLINRYLEVKERQML
ncbi:MAG TPA: DUF58 domain-containing protein [Chthonomonadales bacterium]|nr:DUF58 domain-containing protein [Chthonomonadales bacterium]